MRKWMGIAGLLLVLAGCGEQSLTIEPKQLDEEEKHLITLSVMDFVQMYEMNGKVPEGNILLLEVERYHNGELLRPLMSVREMTDSKYEDASFAFGKSTEVEDAETFVIGIPSGKIDAVHKVSERKDAISTSGNLISGETRIEAGKPVYVGFYAIKAGDRMTGTGEYVNSRGELNASAVAEVDEFYALKLTLAEERVQ